MNINRFKDIIEYSDAHSKEMEVKVRDLYSYLGMDNDKEVLNLMQLVRPLFKDKGYLLIEMPFSDKEIGALCYKGDSLGYSFLNTSLPKVNVNFALCHEIYHLFYQETQFRTKIELYINEYYYQHKEEFSANLFAALLLMPDQSYRLMYRKFQSESRDGDKDYTILVKLMNYFQVPYMASLIRCYQLRLLESGSMLETLIKADSKMIREEFTRLWLDESILDATKKDDYKRLEAMVMAAGERYMEEEYLNDRTLKKVIKNMRHLYIKIKGD